MITASYPSTHAVVAAIMFSALSYGSCTPAPGSDAPASVTVAAGTMAESLSVPSDSDAEPAAALVVHDDVVRRCPALRRFGSQPQDDVAVAAIRSIGECMARGGLRGARLVVMGGGRATKLFRDAITRFDVVDARLQTIVDNSDAADARVDLRLTKQPVRGAREPVVVSVRKSQIIGFLLGTALDD
jgi:hypothetical protein